MKDNNLKFDTGKLRYSLIPTKALEALASILTYGAEKYEAHSWLNLSNGTERYTDALYRHLEAWRGGEMYDEESGRLHLAHALTNVAFLIVLSRMPVKRSKGETEPNTSKTR